MSISRLDSAPTPAQSRGGRPPSRPHQAVLPNVCDEPERPTPCLYDPERWHPDEQLPDPEAVAACWSCFFQSRCALKALATAAEFGIWGGYRLAPGPGLARTRAQLAIVAGREMGPPVSPGPEVDAVLAARTSPADIETPPDPAEVAPQPECEPITAPTVIELSERHPQLRRCATSPGQLALSLALSEHRARAHAG